MKISSLKNIISLLKQLPFYSIRFLLFTESASGTPVICENITCQWKEGRTCKRDRIFLSMPLKKKSLQYRWFNNGNPTALVLAEMEQFFFFRLIPCCRSIEIDRRALEVGLERNYGAIENTFNAADRNSSVKGAKAPARIGLQWLPRTTRTSLPFGEKCICREKGAAIFSGRGLCTKCYSFPAVVSTTTALTREQKKGDGEFTARRKTLGEMYQPLFHDERPESESLFMRDVHTIYDDFVPKRIDIFLSRRAGDAHNSKQWL